MQLILMTKSHSVVGKGDIDAEDAALFLDMDMAVLGSDPQTYQTYADNIHREFAHVGPGLWLLS